MKSAIVSIVGESPYSQGRHYTERDAPRLPKELHDAYERRTWMHRMHVTKDGKVEIPGMAFSNAIKTAAKRLRLRVPGKGKSEYTKHFEAGIMVKDSMVLDMKASEVPYNELFVPSDGKRGGGSRVWKLFPRIDKWGGDISVYIFDDIITPDVFSQVVNAAGMLVGIGVFRPESSGYYGRFSVPKIQWFEEEETMASLGRSA